MDLDGTTSDTITMPEGWVLDSPVIPLAQKIYSATTSRGAMTFQQFVHIAVHTMA